MQNAKNIFFVASCQTEKPPSGGFSVWLRHLPLQSSLRERSDAELGSHSPEWANPRRKARILVRAKGAAKANGESKPPPYDKASTRVRLLQFPANALQSSRFYAIMSVANSINSYLKKSNKGIDILISERRLYRWTIYKN